jgi:hypothetical protein
MSPHTKSNMQTTSTGARATIQAFHARVAAADKKWHEMQAVQKEEEFKHMYSACNSLSKYHDLQCGHRVQTEYTAGCGVLCQRSARGQPFLCPTCLIAVVRAEVALEVLSITKNDTEMVGAGQTQEAKIRHYADKYVADMLKKNYRNCKAVPKLEDPCLQFFDQFMHEEGLGGLQDERVKEEVVRPRKRRGTAQAWKLPRYAPYPKPGTWKLREPSAKAVVADTVDRVLPGADVGDKSEKIREEAGVAKNGILGPSAGSYVTLPLEDEATEAVRKAMEAFALL